MRFSEWEPIYARIAEEFGFSPEKDDEAATVLDSLVAENPRICDEHCLAKKIGKEATVCGGGPNLAADLDSFSPRGTLLVADSAVGAVMERRLWPDIIVTDLDGEIAPQALANENGTVLVVLAHGDNVQAIREIVPRLNGWITPTTQVRPHGRLLNFGGFTDGDRAVELARHLGARKVNLLGFDFGRPSEKEGKDVERKRRKLEWARRIIFEMNPPGVVLWTP